MSGQSKLLILGAWESIGSISAWDAVRLLGLQISVGAQDGHSLQMDPALNYQATAHFHVTSSGAITWREDKRSRAWTKNWLSHY